MLAVLGVWFCADAYDWTGAARWAGVVGSVAVALLLAGWLTPLGRGALLGAGAVAGCLVLWEAGAAVLDGAATAA
ncbi:type VII secretion integral membrane protein EccD, partial [Streptomyces sp. TRM76130]|nr:type VII secretion integral membrane protein EccD [Streptomyces sp. TRM76130]